MEQTIQFQVLGPLRVHTDAGEVAISAVRERTILAMLLLHPGETISVQRLVDAIWAEAPPQNARNQLQGCVSRLRKQLASVGVDRQMIVTTTHGYRIKVESHELDLLQFRQLRDEARIAAADGDREGARQRYRSALTLWRGSVLDDVASQVVQRIAAALEEEQAQALEERIEIDLSLGGAGDLVAELTSLVERYPYREGLHGALMRALYQAGRQADALAAYRRVRQLLRDELGAEPGAELQSLHQAILNQDSELRPAPLTMRSIDAQPVPRELPTDVTGFVGRADALAYLDGLVPDGESTAPAPVVISAIAGTAGVGKTALAVHWAHRVANRFPDGQLYINLHGFDPVEPPTRSAEALRGFLDALGIPPQRIPATVDAKARLFRSLVADKRMLVVLDNAREPAQVRPLLPGTSSCLVVVTSRNRLTGLAVTDGARCLALDLLTRAEAHQLLAQRLGAERLSAEPQAVEEVITRCSRLPLALAVVAARAATHPNHSLSRLAQELKQARTSLDALCDPDPASNLRAALDVTCQALTPETANLYRLLGLHPGSDIDSYAVAALADTSLADARRQLNQLYDANLLRQPVSGRYMFHNLIRAHAADTATAETDAARRAALARLLDHYLHTAFVATSIVYPYAGERPPPAPVSETPIPQLTNASRAAEWLDTELSNLLAAVHYAADSGWPEHTRRLSALLHQHLRTRGRYRDAEATDRVALSTARTFSDRAGELEAAIRLGEVHRLQGRPEQSLRRFRQALDIARTTGNRTGELRALVGLGDTDQVQGRYELAIDHIRCALEIARVAGYRNGELEALISLGQIHMILGRPEETTDYFTQALDLARAIGNRAGELQALVGLGEMCRLLVRYRQALDYLGQAFEVARSIGHHRGELMVLAGLGHAHRRLGHYQQAADCYRRILDVSRENDDHRNVRLEATYGLGRLHQGTDRAVTALAYHRDALDLATELDQPIDRAKAHDGIAHAYLAMNHRHQAREHWQHALDILIRLGVDQTEDGEARVATIEASLAGIDQRPETSPGDA